MLCNERLASGSAGGLIAFNIGHWQPRIGDPSFMGWATVVSYYLCAGLSLACVLKFWPRLDRTDRRFWLSMTAIVLMLGVSKHFNLPAALTEIGRILVHQIGGYELRRWLQVVMLGFVALGLVFLIRQSVGHKVLLGVWQRHAPEMICLGYLCGLVILRAISFHHVGTLLSAEVFGVRINWIAELGGIYALVAILLTRTVAVTSPGK